MNGCMYQPYLFIYRLNDLKPEMEIKKYDWTTRLGSKRKGSKFEHNISQTEM